MKIDERKKQVARCEAGLDNAMRRLTLATTVVKRWRQRLKTQERTLLRELEARATAPLTDAPVRRFRD